MSDVCEALIVFSVYSVFSVDSRKKFSCSFVLFVVPSVFSFSSAKQP